MTQRDPLKVLGDWLIDAGLTDRRVIEQIEADVKKEIQKGVEFALNAPYPDTGEVDQDVYA